MRGIVAALAVLAFGGAATAQTLPLPTQITAAALNGALTAMAAKTTAAQNAASSAASAAAAAATTANAAFPSFINATNTSAAAKNMGSPCAGNAGTDGVNIPSNLFAYGIMCSFVKPPAPIQFGGTGGFQYPQTYAWQIGLELPDLPSNPNVVPSGTVSTDQVAFYPEIRLNAWSPSGWAENPLVAMNSNSGGGIISEMDLNNFEGCDSSGIDSDANTTGGSNPFIANRSDGSACPGGIGLLVTGVGNRISRSAIAISGVSNSAGDMWQDGLRMIGGYLINEADFMENTGSRSVLKAEGVHTRGIDLASGHFSFGAITLADSVDGKIVWECPTGAPANSKVTQCVTGYPPSGMFIFPYSDGMMHFSSGAPWHFDGNVGVNGGIIIVGATATQSGLNASSTTGPAVTVDTHGVLSAGPVIATAIQPYAGGSPLPVGTLSGVTFQGAAQLFAQTYSSLVVGCTSGQMVFVSDGRKPGEAAGAGSGAPAICTPVSKGSATMAWYSVFSGTVVAN